MSNLGSILLMAQGSGGQQSSYMSFLPMILIFIVIYFFMIRPQQKKQKELATYRSSVKSGDKIITTGGIYGKIVSLQDNTVIIEVEDRTKIKIDRSAIVKDMTDIAK